VYEELLLDDGNASVFVALLSCYNTDSSSAIQSYTAARVVVWASADVVFTVFSNEDLVSELVHGNLLKEVAVFVLLLLSDLMDLNLVELLHFLYALSFYY